MSEIKSAKVLVPVIKRIKYIVFGEVLYDCFPDGHQVAGGAPFNVAWGLRGLGHDVNFVSAIGDDDPGESLRNLVREWNLDDSCLQVNTLHPTGKVTVALSGGEATYTVHKSCAWDFIEDPLMEATHLLYHGSLALRNPVSRANFEALEKRSKDAIRFFDVNLRTPHYKLDQIKKWMRKTHWLKLNLDELEEITGLSGLDISNSEEILTQLKSDFEIDNILLTAGERGAVIHGSREYVSKIPSPSPHKLIDTVGAGDGFTAMTLHGILNNYSLDQIVEMASSFASKICQMQGATSKDPNFYQIKT